MQVGRFAPSTTGAAHPGTLLAALLCWLDVRSRGGRVLLRLEDLDPERASPDWARGLRADLAWLGLDWDGASDQSDHAADHAAALDRLAASGVLYPCACSRARVREGGERAPDGGWRYPGTCRERALPTGGWRACDEALRVRLPPGAVVPHDEGGLDLAQDPGAAFGDPVVRRRDGAVAYHLASVVDDAREGVTRVVRGRDLAASTATQAALQRLLGLTTPVYRHHFLLLEERPAEGGGRKLAKLHGSVSAAELRAAGWDGARLVGWLAHAAGLAERPEPASPLGLVAGFDWSRVETRDRVVRWRDGALELAS